MLAEFNNEVDNNKLLEILFVNHIWDAHKVDSVPKPEFFKSLSTKSGNR